MNSKSDLARTALESFKEKVDKELDGILEKEVKEAKNYSPFAVGYMKELRSLSAVGGKRLRPSFVYYTYKLCRGEDLDRIITVAAAIELVHLFLLIEDDFMDLADYRRGYPTINATYSRIHEKSRFKKNSRHFGDTIAVNIGILTDHLAANIILNSGFDINLIKKALNQLNQQIITTGHGQIHDMLNEVRSGLSEEDIINVLYWKTGIYTYNNPIQIGAILAGAEKMELDKLAEYAIPGGVAFQIQDDILGTFGDEKTTGKSSDGDIVEGKQTLLTFYSSKYGTKAQRDFLATVLGNPNSSKEEIQKVREIFIETGALKRTKKKALDLVKEAKASLLRNKVILDWDGRGVDFLEGIADYMIERNL